MNSVSMCPKELAMHTAAAGARLLPGVFLKSPCPDDLAARAVTGGITSGKRLSREQLCRILRDPATYRPGFFTLGEMESHAPSEFDSLKSWVAGTVIPCEIRNLFPQGSCLSSPQQDDIRKSIFSYYFEPNEISGNIPFYKDLTMIQFLNAVHLTMFGWLEKLGLLEQADIYGAYRRESSDIAIGALQAAIRSKIGIERAIFLSAAGNYFDPNVPGLSSLDDVYRQLFSDVLGRGFSGRDLSDSRLLKERLAAVRKAVFFFDNRGEAVFDLMFIKTMVEVNPSIEVTLVPKGTMLSEDANYADIENALEAPVFRGLSKHRGIDLVKQGPPFKGVDLRFINNGIAQAIIDSDIVIRKGTTNWDSMQGLNKDSFCLFLVKGLTAQTSTGYSRNVPLNKKHCICAYLPAGTRIGSDYFSRRQWQKAGNTDEQIYVPVSNLLSFRSGGES